MNRRRTPLAALALALTVALVPSASMAQAADPAAGFKRHENQYWTWYAPKGWIASYGANGIDITSPVGDDYVGYGAGGVYCDGSYGPKEYFDYVRGTLKNQGGLYPKKLKSAGYTKVGAITNPYGAGYFRQRSFWRGKAKNGTLVQGEIVLDLFVVDPYSNACGQRGQVRSAPSNGYGKTIKVLRRIQSLLFQHPASR